MDRMRNRVAVLILVIAIVAGLLACGPGGLIGREEFTPTPTKTPKPTFTATLTPSLTPVPTDTPLPTDTPTPVPPTNTPIILTATFTPAPTDTPTPIPPTATATRKPTAKPPAKTKTPTPKPAPTNTPAPAYAFTGRIVGGTPNCGTTGVKGKIKTKTGAAYPGVTVAVWTDGWDGTVSNPADLGGNWNVLLDTYDKPGTWYVRVVKKETCQPYPSGQGYTANCTGWLSDRITVTTTKCNVPGAVNWPEIDFQQN